MSRLFGGIEQLGIVVRDAETTMREWSERLGVGPFFVFREVEFQNFRYRGEPSRSPVVTLGFAQSGNVQLEVIQQHNDVPSAYTDFLAAGYEGAQHVSSWFDEAAAYDEKRAELLQAGLTLIHEGSTVGGLARFAYFATNLRGGMAIEISEARNPALLPLLNVVTNAAHTWDGSNAIREFPTV